VVAADRQTVYSRGVEGGVWYQPDGVAVYRCMVGSGPDNETLAFLCQILTVRHVATLSLRVGWACTYAKGSDLVITVAKGQITACARGGGVV
jgi:hypothetical protein